MDTILVTGGTGFVGGWAIVELLRRGYAVRTTVRSLAKEPWLRAQIATQVDAGDRLSFVIADLTRDEGWDEAVEGCEAVLHVAAPVGVSAPKNPDDLIIPTRDGALRVLRAACRADVRRVVMTSAIEACRPRLTAPDGIYDERGWTDLHDRQLGSYRLAKTLAEKAAWEFMSTQSGRTTLTTILPSAIMGPVFSSEYGHSLVLMKRLLSGTPPATPNIGFCVVDVRDVVSLHILAMENEAAAGERFIAASEWTWMVDIAGILRNHLGQAAQKVPTRSLPDIVLRIVALFDRPARFVVPLLGRKHIFSSAKAERILGWRPRSGEETILAAAKSAIAVKAVQSEP
ncbi:NAD-dependent epimerase/dehydratase family protein [Neorhizobium petrolearium]|uniref:NAD-dependent epimerase/dehydratase family protein n=1 Tax=Neorhizobium petrolearium TaxID=515361 RepID=UPI003F7CE683